MPAITSRAMALGLVLALLAPRAAATGPGRGKGKGTQDRPRDVEIVKEGKIRVVRAIGAEPQLTDQNDERYLCTGPLREELLRLGGHNVRAWGAVGEKKLMIPTFWVARYAILDAGGRKPLVGTLRQQGKEQLVLERAEGNLNIAARPALLRMLRRRLLCTIWIVGELQGTTLRAFKFGWIRCPPHKGITSPIKPRKEIPK